MLGPRARSLALALSFCCAAALASADAAAQTRPTAALGYSPAERRAVEERLARTEAERDGLADRLGVSRRLMRAVATEVGLANPRFTDSQFFTAVEEMAERVQELQADNTRLRDEITRLSDPALRDPALALLEQAETALEEGRLADAEAVFGQIGNLRWGESSDALSAWITSVRSQATTAELQGSEEAIDRADALDRQAEDLWGQLQERAAAERLASRITRMERGLREGELLGRRRGLERAVTIFREELAAEAESDPLAERIVPAQVIYVRALGLLGERDGGSAGKALYDEAILHVGSNLMGGSPEALPGLPRDLRLALAELIIGRVELMDTEELRTDGGALSQMFQMNLQTLMPGFSMNSLADFRPEHMEALGIATSLMARFVNRPDYDDIARSDTLDIPSFSRNSEEFRELQKLVTVTNLVMAMALLGISPMPQVVDPQSSPQTWIDHALNVAAMLASDFALDAAGMQSEIGPVPPVQVLLATAVRLAQEAEGHARRIGNHPSHARALTLQGAAALRSTSLLEGTERGQAITFAVRAYTGARDLQTADEMPVEWAEASVGLAKSTIVAARASGGDVCSGLAQAQQLYAGAIAVAEGRLVASRMAILLEEQAALADQALADCHTASESASAAVAGSAP